MGKGASQSRLLSIFLALACTCVGVQSGAQQLPPPPPSAPEEVAAATPQEEYLAKIDASRTLAPLDQNLFGDSINDYTGSVQFSVTDVELPGNDALRVAIARRFDVNELRSKLRKYAAFGAPFRDWDFDIPHMHGVFATSTGWQAGTTANLRCAQSNLSQSAPPAIGIFEPDDYWAGNMLYVPGQGDDEILHLDDGAEVKPSDGLAYHWVTKGRWYFSCLTSTANGVAGDSFFARAPDGTKYWFNQIVDRPTAPMQKGAENGQLPRREVWIMPTRVEDRFGNNVTYTYSTSDPWNILAIDASDGRHLALTYPSPDGSGYVSTVSDGTRTWTYGYSGSSLTSVTLPDASKVLYDFSTFHEDHTDVSFTGCSTVPQFIYSFDFVATITHPSGAIGKFTFDYKTHGRSYVQKNCWFSSFDSGDRIPAVFTSLSLTKKEISGPGLPTPLTWGWTYPTLAYSYTDSTCAATSSCPTTKLVTIAQPDGSTRRETFGVRYGVNDGLLLESDVVDSSNATLRAVVTDYLVDPTGQNYDALVGDPFKLYNDPGAGVPRPLWHKETTQQGETFLWEVEGCSLINQVCRKFDSFARPTKIYKASDTASKDENIGYSDNLSVYVLGQVASISISQFSGPTAPVEHTDYDPSTALPTAKYLSQNPTPQVRYGYCAPPTGCTPGTLSSIKDGIGNTTTFGDWKRGIPRTITYANGKMQSAVVNDAGWIDSMTDQNAFLTTYGHDPMGRLTSVSYPTGDTVAWNTTTQTFSPIASTEYGLSLGHWKQVTSTGNARTETYFDALWRPVVTIEFDNGDKTNTQRTTLRGYDSAGHQNYVSYPQRTVTAYSDRANTTNKTFGVSTTYDALDREIQTQAYSELGTLTTSTSYSATAFTKAVTNPRGQTTTYAYLTYDQPSYAMPYQITAPESLSITIDRDDFGKTTSIVRSGTNQVDGSSVTATRRYVYDSYQRLCKTIEPEIGATIRDYDLADNVAWIATGFPSLTNVNQCDRTDSGVIASKVSRVYDALNRLTDISGIAQPIHRTYTPDGLPETISAGSVLWTYGYNKRRLPTTEVLSGTGVLGATLVTGYNANGKVQALTYPDGVQVDYAPNALGEPTQAKKVGSTTEYAKVGTKMYPNGAIQTFTYGNGIVHSLTQNARGLPWESKDVGVLDDIYTYDQDANVTGITDQLPGGSNTRSMGYDNLDRLSTANATGIWGTASYKYDALDNLRSSIVGTRSYTHAYDSNNRLQALNAGNIIMGFSYDQQGNLSQRGTQTFSFDRANELQSTSGSLAVNSESYVYDGNGRRVTVNRSVGGSHHYFVYSQSGQLRYEMDTSTNTMSDYIYLGGSLIAREDNGPQTTPLAPVVTAPANNNTGTYTVTFVSAGATYYSLEENGIVKISNQPGTSYLVTLQANGTYQYQAQACNPVGCSAFSSVATSATTIVSGVSVPASPSTIVANPSPSNTGNFELRWPGVAGATAYWVQENVNATGWVDLPTISGTILAITGKPTGSYSYRVRACMGACSTYSNPTTETVTVVSVPTPPTLTVPSSTTNGNFSLTRGTSAGATRYELQELPPTAWAWTTLTTSMSASYQLSRDPGRYAYQARACNASGCGNFGTAGTIDVSVVVAPPTPTGLTATPNPSKDGFYTVSWSASPGTNNSYVLERNSNGGGWTQRNIGSGTSFAESGVTAGVYSYRVSACHGTTCSTPSATIDVAEDAAPLAVSSLSLSPNPSTSGTYTVSWVAPVGANFYYLDEQVGTGPWVQAAPSSQTATTATFTDRGAGSYSYRIRACRLTDAVRCNSTYSATATESVQIAGAPAAPDHIDGPPLCTNSPRTYTITWGAVTGIPYVTSYEVNESTDSVTGGLNQTLLPTPATGTSLTLTRNLIIGGQHYESINYLYKVRACIGNNCSAWTGPVGVCVGINNNGPQPPAIVTTVKYVHTDGLRSPVAESDAVGRITKRSQYEPYGAPTTGYLDGPGFTGHYTDTATQLTYMQQRYYDPIAGRFLSADPVPASATGFNRYSYANNNPYRFIDPFGLWTCSGSKSYCEAFEQLLRMIKDASTDSKLNKSQQKMLSAIVDGYGAKGDDSVRVTFKGSGNSDGSTRRAVDEKTGKSYEEINIYEKNIQVSGGGFLSRLGGVIVHEGQHNADDLARGRDIDSKAERKETEVQAYRSEAIWYKATDYVHGYDAIWTPGRGFNESAIDTRAEDSVTNACSRAPGSGAC